MDASLLSAMLKSAPLVCLFGALVIHWFLRRKASKGVSLDDLFVVGMTASAIPSGLLLIVAAWNSSALTLVADAPVYLVLAGLSVLFIVFKTIREKLNTP